ncbi:MAG: hypothetical protein ACLGH0_07285 [Thermoanaerobaculia bacterium]
MNCHREDELLDALGRGFIGAELDAHVAGCASCSELRLVAGALLDDRVVAAKEAAVPSAGAMWWRMQLRRRHDAQAAARQSLMIGQAITLLVGVVLIASLFGADIVAGVKAMSMKTLLFLILPLLLAPFGALSLRWRAR